MQAVKLISDLRSLDPQKKPQTKNGKGQISLVSRTLISSRRTTVKLGSKPMTDSKFEELIKLKQQQLELVKQEIKAHDFVIQRLEQMLSQKDDDDLLS